MSVLMLVVHLMLFLQHQFVLMSYRFVCSQLGGANDAEGDVYCQISFQSQLQSAQQVVRWSCLHFRSCLHWR